MSMDKFSSWVKGELELIAFVGEPGEKPTRTPTDRNTREARLQRRTLIVNIIAVALVALFLLAMVANLPLFGTGEATENELTERYIEQGVTDVGAVNLVANMILIYRGFDTFGESTVLFAAAVCVIILLQNDSKNFSREDEERERKAKIFAREENAVVLRKVSVRLAPFMMLFSVYILLNGHLSPGGGFSGGAVLGGTLIMIDVALGQDLVGSFFNHKVYNVVKVGALCVYAAILLWLVLRGSNGLATFIGTGTPGRIFSAGAILPINVMVGFEVACTIYAFYAYFSRGELN